MAYLSNGKVRPNLEMMNFRLVSSGNVSISSMPRSRLAAFARPLLGLRPVQLLELPLALPLESLPELRLVQPPKLRLEQNRRRMPAEKEVSQAAAERVSPALVIRLPQETPAREQAGQAKSANRAQA